MTETLTEIQTEVMELSSNSKEEVLDLIERMYEESYISKLTLIVKKSSKPLSLMSQNKVNYLQHQLRPTRKQLSKFSMNLCPSFQNQEDFNEPSNSKLKAVNSERLVGKRISSLEEQNLKYGLNLYHEGYYQNAYQIFKKVEEDLHNQKDTPLSESKDFQEINFHLGNCLFRLKKYNESVQYLAVKFETEDIRQKGQRNQNLGSCYAALKNYRLSLNAYSQALKIYHDFPDIDCSNLLNNLGIVYSKCSMYDTAVKYFSQAIDERKAKSPEHSFMLCYSYKQKGVCLKSCHKYQEAATSLLLALNFAERGFGNLTEIFQQLAMIYELMENWSEALKYYEKLSEEYLKKQLNQGFIYENVALIYQKIGNQIQYSKFMKIAYNEYKKNNNERKLSQLNAFIQTTQIK